MGLGVLQGCGWCSGPQIGGQSRLGTQVSPHFPTLPGISHVWAGDKARGRRGSRWLSDSALCVAGPMRHTAAHAEPPAGAPWPAVTSPLCQHQGVDSFPPGSMEQDLTGLGLHPRLPMHTHWPTVLGSGGPGPSRLHRAACSSIRPPDLGAPQQREWGPWPGLHLLLPSSREASETGLRPSTAQWAPVGPCQHRLGPHRPQRSGRDQPFPALALVDAQPQTGAPCSEGSGESHHGDSRPTQLGDAPASETSGASSGIRGLAGPCSQAPHLWESGGRPGALAGQHLAQNHL